MDEQHIEQLLADSRKKGEDPALPSGVRDLLHRAANTIEELYNDLLAAREALEAKPASTEKPSNTVFRADPPQPSFPSKETIELRKQLEFPLVMDHAKTIIKEIEEKVFENPQIAPSADGVAKVLNISKENLIYGYLSLNAVSFLSATDIINGKRISLLTDLRNSIDATHDKENQELRMALRAMRNCSEGKIDLSPVEAITIKAIAEDFAKVGLDFKTFYASICEFHQEVLESDRNLHPHRKISEQKLQKIFENQATQEFSDGAKVVPWLSRGSDEYTPSRLRGTSHDSRKI